jgi:hypothetical protein
MFEKDLDGILMRVEEDPTTRYRYEVWFDYTRKTINTIAEGAMLAAPNFAGHDKETHYSILEVAGILPVHYALGDDTRGYPGFVVEAARNAGQDWVTQDEVSTEDTTKIRCVAIPTNLEIVETVSSVNGGAPKVQEEGNLPMVGHRVHLLDTQMTEEVANLALDLKRDNVIQIGTLVRDDQVRAYLRVEDLIQVHFGIFGFTGAGKSNLLSTVIRKLLTESKNPATGNEEPLKIVVFDLMSEYTGLLLDQLVGRDGSYIVNVGAQTVPESVLTYYEKPNRDAWKRATIDLVNSTVLPKALKRRQQDLYHPSAKLLRDEKVLFVKQQQRTVGEMLKEGRDKYLKGNLGNSSKPMRNFLNDLIQAHRESTPSPEVLEKLQGEVRQFADGDSLSKTAVQNLDELCEDLELMSTQAQDSVPEAAQIATKKIVDELNDDSGSSLIIFQSHDPDALRDYAAMLAGVAYESRRKTGQITPLVSFVFDEADEFIPGQPTNDSQKRTKAAAMTLARRGRKFGLGIGISTQRIRYLDTNILAQPHTYFISKLPRLSDRQAIAEAFGISEDMFRQTFKFKKGDWLLASYDAAGLEAIPIPIHTEDANERIIALVEEQKSSAARTTRS